MRVLLWLVVWFNGLLRAFARSSCVSFLISLIMSLTARLAVLLMMWQRALHNLPDGLHGMLYPRRLGGRKFCLVHMQRFHQERIRPIFYSFAPLVEAKELVAVGVAFSVAVVVAVLAPEAAAMAAAVVAVLEVFPQMMEVGLATGETVVLAVTVAGLAWKGAYPGQSQVDFWCGCGLIFPVAKGKNRNQVIANL